MSIKRKILDFAVRTAMLPIDRLSRMKPGYADICMQRVVHHLETRSDSYCSVKKRPRSCDAVYLEETESRAGKLSAIILQGQLIAEDNFTVETVRTYARLFPDALVIVSTWDTDDQEIIGQLRMEKNCHLVLSSYPDHSGLLNLNYQVTTTMAGVRKAKELGREYIFKTRCDYRFYKKGLLDYLYCLLQEFPVDRTCRGQRYRIVAGGEVRNSMYRPFWLADQFNYGYVDDILQYWDHPLDPMDISKRDVSMAIKERHYTWNERTENRLAVEPELVLDFLERAEGHRPGSTVREYWEAVRKRFILVSRQELGFYWFKYDHKYDESFSEGTYYNDDSAEKGFVCNWDFARWLSLYCGALTYDEKYERFSNDNRY